MIDYGLGVTLRAIDEIPLEILREWRNDYRIWRYCRQNDIISKFRQNEWKEKIIGDPSIQMYSIFDCNNQGIGVCGLTGLDLVNRHAEFSLYIAPTFQGQGNGKNALKTLISHGFNTYGLEVIWGESFDHNPATKIFTDIEMKQEGTRRHFYFREGGFIDAHLFSILRSEWEKSEKFNDCRVQRCSS